MFVFLFIDIIGNRVGADNGSEVMIASLDSNSRDKLTMMVVKHTFVAERREEMHVHAG